MKKRILSILLALCMLLCLVPTTAFAADCAEDLVDPVIWIHLSSDGGGYYDVLNGTWTAADFFQPGKAPKGAKITAVTPPTSPSIPVSVNVNSDGTLNCTKTENTTEPVPKSETYTVTITSDDYAPISAPLTVRQYLNAGFRGPVYFDDELLYGDTYTYTCRVNNPGENGVWSALIQDPQMFEIYKETTDTTSEPGKSIYTVHIRAIKAGARVTCIDFLYVSDTTMASSKVSRGAVTGGAVRTRPLTVTAGSATITEGDALPTDLVSCTGLLDSEGSKDDRDTVLDNALGYQLLDANNEEVTAATARNMPGTYTVVPAATLKSGWGERYSLNKVNGTLTVENQPDEQFTLAPGGRYYFDLSAMNIPGTVNSNLPDSTLHYVPFTYVGTVNAYKLTSETATTQAYAQQNKYLHSLFIADHAVTNDVSWDALNTADLIFGKDYAAGGVNYTLRAPSAGSSFTGSGDSERGTPQSNEWDRILDKNDGYIKNWDGMFSWGQDTFERGTEPNRAVRGLDSARHWSDFHAMDSRPFFGFRPVLEVLNPGTLGADGLKAVTLDLGGGKLGNSSENIQIIVKNGESFTAPATEGLSRPNSISEDAQLYWSDENGNCYKPGDTVPADVSRLLITGEYEVIYLPGTYGTGSAVTDMKPHNNILTLRGALFTRKGYTQVGWATVDGGEKVYGFEDVYTQNEALTLYPVWNANQYTVTFDSTGGSEVITKTIEVTYGEPLGDMPVPKREGYVFLGWYDALVGGKCYGDSDGKSTSPYDKDVSITLYAQWAEAPSRMVYFNTCGGTMTGPVEVLHKLNTPIAKPDNPTKPGHTFNGWYTDSALTQAWNFDDWVTGELKLYAGWTVNQYTITFDTNGGSEIAPITQDYGTAITAPANPTREGYTFLGWDKAIPATMPAENMTITAKWKVNQYTITFDTAGGSAVAPITQNYGTAITAPESPTREGYTFIGWDKAIPTTMPAENMTIKAKWKDTEKPTGEIIIGTNKWNEFLNELTFGIFFKDTQEVTINAVDNSGVVFVSYLVTDKELSEAELNSLVFRAYEEPFSIDPNGEYIVYVMLVDENINITYLRSDRITLDNIQPVISGIENGKTYCEAQTVTVDEKYVDTVTVNGTAVTLDADGGFVLSPTNGEQKIVVTDKAGNNAEMTVTVNNGHTFGEWVSDNDGKHTRKCIVDGCDAFETENCSGGNATCTEKAVCDVCGKAYGELDGTNHEGGVQEWTTRTAFNHEQKWNCCGAVIVASEAHEWKDGVCRECGYVCLHNDADKDHICNYCKKTISAHEDATPEEIKKPDTVTAKPDDSKSPQTGDNGNLVLWIALLIISGGVMKGVTAFGKSKKHSAKIKDK